MGFTTNEKIVMRINDPKTAPLVPITFTLDWNEGMDVDVRDIKIIGWDRTTDLAVEFSGRLLNLTLKKRSLDKDDREWLKAIGVRNG